MDRASSEIILKAVTRVLLYIMSSTFKFMKRQVDGVFQCSEGCPDKWVRSQTKDAN